MSKIKLLADQPVVIQIIAVVVMPVIFGVITGYSLSWSLYLYFALILASVAGGIAAGYEHKRALSGMLRVVVGASLFASGIALGDRLSEAPALLPLPELGVLLIINVIAGGVLGSIGGALRGRAHRKSLLQVR
ncbi:hypothetical protein M2D07_031340 [Pseudomonas sp. BGr12]|uniref:hypothetical protein n=1 Tax=Pseudomonas sp. BGr12 TaxID=2936269 RepID=UPI0025597971|nr:hypothetical protein [Pseudomonas sp. BJa5]MDL2431538.1 hypothetical protein [Pseudomonas sp. BJa5]